MRHSTDREREISMNRSTTVFTFILLASVGCGGGAAQQNRFQLQSQRYLDTAYDSRLAGRGYNIDHELTGSLEEGRSETHDVRLRGGQAYAILGACDNDCGDLDLFLLDDDGNEIDSDVSTDDFPIVRYSPRRTGEYRVRVRMYECDTEPCFFAVGVYSRDR
jgi:hypothetical protein